MSNPNSIGICFFGLDPKDLAVFDRVIEFVEKKKKHFHRCPAAAAKLLIANDDPASISLANKQASQTLIIISNNTASEEADVLIKRPLLITKVMRAMDESSKQYLDVPAPLQTAKAAPQQEYKFHALVVDDSAAIRKQLEIELRETAISADYAKCGEEALELIEQNQYDLVFLDIIMPGINGYEVCKQIRHNVAYKRTPVIMLSGKTEPLDEVEGILAGASTYLLKPVKHQDFQDTLSRIAKWLDDFA